jgi:hypothetical protein
VSAPSHRRPFTERRYRTGELPDTPTRHFRIPAAGWTDAPEILLTLGDELGEPVEYKRRIGDFFLWRAGPPVGRAIYLAIDVEDPGHVYRFDLEGRTGSGLGPDGVEHVRFRAWKEALLAEARKP